MPGTGGELDRARGGGKVSVPKSCAGSHSRSQRDAVDVMC